MPLARYFLFVGGALLSLLVLVGSLWETSHIVGDHGAKPAVVLPIFSDRKLPERVVFDTSARDQVVAAVVAETPATDDVPSAAVQAPEREAFAMLQPNKAEPVQPPRAKSQVNTQVVRAKGQRSHARRWTQPHRPLFAQRQFPQGWFGNVMW